MELCFILKWKKTVNTWTLSNPKWHPLRLWSEQAPLCFSNLLNARFTRGHQAAGKSPFFSEKWTCILPRTLVIVPWQTVLQIRQNVYCIAVWAPSAITSKTLTFARSGSTGGLYRDTWLQIVLYIFFKFLTMFSNFICIYKNMRKYL